MGEVLAKQVPNSLKLSASPAGTPRLFPISLAPHAQRTNYPLTPAPQTFPTPRAPADLAHHDPTHLLCPDLPWAPARPPGDRGQPSPSLLAQGQPSCLEATTLHRGSAAQLGSWGLPWVSGGGGSGRGAPQGRVLSHFCCSKCSHYASFHPHSSRALEPLSEANGGTGSVPSVLCSLSILIFHRLLLPETGRSILSPH